MDIVRVYFRGTMPETCGSCYHIVVRPKGRRVFWECYFVEGNIESRDMPRPKWCPLSELKENEQDGVYRFVGKGNITPNLEMWVDEQKKESNK